jgi:replicative DNA helicase
MKLKKLSDVVEDTKKYLIDRKEGNVLSLSTKYKKLNKMTMNGFESNTIACLSALSGFGKSTIAKEIRDSLPDVPMIKLCFNFEMLAIHQMTRSLSSKKKMSLRKMYSLEKPLNDQELSDLLQQLDDLKHKYGDDVLFVETMLNHAQIGRLIMRVYNELCKEQEKFLYVEIDHALLTLGKEGEAEKVKIDNLMLTLLKTKKDIAADGGNCFMATLSQMNREIRSEKRITNDELHRPDTSCLFGASSIEFACDYIIFNHIPGRLGLKHYTEDRLPVKYLGTNQVTGAQEEKYVCYFELVKNRSGKPDQRFALFNNLEVFELEEMSQDQLRKLAII